MGRFTIASRPSLRILIIVTVVVGVIWASGPSPVGAGAAVHTERISVGPGGVDGDDFTYTSSSMSADGRYVAFASPATNLVEGDSNGVWDVFVYDRTTQQTRLVSVSSDGSQGNAGSYRPTISADGRVVTFTSYASNLVEGDTNDELDVFVRDESSRQTQRVSVSSSGTQGNGENYWTLSAPLSSADGRFVAFGSDSTNLVEGDTNGVEDVFVFDRVTQATQRISVNWAGEEANGPSYDPVISAHGRFVAFESNSSNLVRRRTEGPNIYVYDRTTGRVDVVSVSSTGRPGGGRWPAISANGRFVAFDSSGSNLVEGDTNGAWDVFVHDRVSQRTRRVSISSTGVQGNRNSYYLAISADGRSVAFQSLATDLIRRDTNQRTDVFVHDLTNHRTRRVSVGTTGAESDWPSSLPAISPDGRWVSFVTAAQLVGDDTNGELDVYLRGPLP